MVEAEGIVRIKLQVEGAGGGLGAAIGRGGGGGGKSDLEYLTGAQMKHRGAVQSAMSGIPSVAYTATGTQKGFSAALSNSGGVLSKIFKVGMVGALAGLGLVAAFAGMARNSEAVAGFMKLISAIATIFLMPFLIAGLKFFEKFGVPILDKLIPAIDEVSTALSEDKAPGTTPGDQSISGAIERNLLTVSNAIEPIKNETINILDRIGAWMREWQGKLISGDFGGALETLGRGLNTVVNEFITASGSFIGGIITWGQQSLTGLLVWWTQFTEKDLPAWIDEALKAISGAWNWLITNLRSVLDRTIAGLQFLVSLGATLLSTIIAKIQEGLGVLVGLGQSIANMITGAISSAFGQAGTFISNILTGNKRKQFGGIVPNTGLYMMHAGERVTRSDQAEGGFGGSITVNVNNPQMNNETDIRELARELARYTQIELNRRVSFSSGV